MRNFAARQRALGHQNVRPYPEAYSRARPLVNAVFYISYARNRWCRHNIPYVYSLGDAALSRTQDESDRLFEVRIVAVIGCLGQRSGRSRVRSHDAPEDHGDATPHARIGFLFESL